MSTHMAYELLPESGKVRIFTAFSTINPFVLIFSLQFLADLLRFLQVVAFDVDLPVKQAFHILHEQVKELGIPSSQ